MNVDAKNEGTKRARARKPSAPKKAVPPKAPPASSSARITDLDDKALAAHLLAKPTIADTAWSASRDVPAREKGEMRDAYIRRVLLGEKVSA